MKAIRLSVLALPLVLALGTGCGEVDANTQAQYPLPPVGYDPPPPATAESQAGLPGQQAGYYGTQPQEAAPPPAEQAAAPEGPQGDVAIGADEPGQEYTETDPSALTDFRSTLEPYGQWVDDPNYGTIWVPSQEQVGADFSPYVTAGHWTYDNDYTWVSDYSWGWAPFHYGRWAYAGNHWGWIPGRRYAGAWVDWRVGTGDWAYVGWAPLGPTYYWRGGSAYRLGFNPTHAYAFCGTGDLFRTGIAGHIVTGPQVGVVAGHTRSYTPANPTVGPRVPGPTPQSIGIHPSQVAVTPTNHTGLARAQAFATPASHAAVVHGVASSYGPRTPGNAMSRSQPTFRGQYYAPSRPSYSAPSRSYSGGYARPSYSAPSRAPSYAAPSYHAPSYSAPSYHAPAPSYHPPSYSAPSHPSSSGGGGGGYHPSGGGGGGHSGGGHSGGHR